MDQSPYKCIEQERAYTDGWRDCISGEVNRNAFTGSHHYALGWNDATERLFYFSHTLHRLWPMIDPRPAASGE